MKIKLYAPAGMFGASDSDSELTTALREIAVAAGNELDWPGKYGAQYENNVFAMHPFCWCEKEDCIYCREKDKTPNFHHKPSGLKVWWYKYIGRDMETQTHLQQIDIQAIKKQCMASVK